MSNKIEQIESKQKEIARNQTTFNPNFKSYCDNLPIPSFANPFGRNTAKRISTLKTDQLADTNHTRVEHISLSATNIRPKELVIGSTRLGENIIAEANQPSDSIDRWGHSDWDFHFGSEKSGNKMSVDFRRNVDDKIGTNPSRTIGSPSQQITRTRLSKCNIFNSVIRVSLWNITMRS